jgi:hypothetical protein
MLLQQLIVCCLLCMALLQLCDDGRMVCAVIKQLIRCGCPFCSQTFQYAHRAPINQVLVRISGIVARPPRW